MQLTTETIPRSRTKARTAKLANAWRLIAWIQQTSGRLGEAAQSIAKVISHARLAGDERLARAAPSG